MEEEEEEGSRVINREKKNGQDNSDHLCCMNDVLVEAAGRSGTEASQLSPGNPKY